MSKEVLHKIIAFVSIAASLLLAALSLTRENMSFLSSVAASLMCLPFLISYEKSAQSGRTAVIAAVMTAIAVVGRFIFAQAPGFKPVTAVTVITGMYLGPQAGFITGALSALISNIYFGQGPWTPFEMLAWGMTGFLGGVLNKRGLLEKKLPLLLYGALAGVLYSLIMDIYTTLVMMGGFTLRKYLAALLSSAWFTGIYIESNVIFLLLIMLPVSRCMKRIKLKYGL